MKFFRKPSSPELKVSPYRPRPATMRAWGMLKFSCNPLCQSLNVNVSTWYVSAGMMIYACMSVLSRHRSYFHEKSSKADVLSFSSGSCDTPPPPPPPPGFLCAGRGGGVISSPARVSLAVLLLRSYLTGDALYPE
jgi:hypothetical protein